MAVIGVVISMHNGRDLLAPTVESVRRQTLEDFLCVMVDDGSTDGTADFARRLGDERFRVVEQGNAGASSARNHGLAELPATVDYVSFLDQDDVLEPDALALLASAARSDPSYVGAHGIGRFVDENGQSFGNFEDHGRTRWAVGMGADKVRLPLDRPTTFASQLLTCTVFPPGLLLARRSAYDQLGGFDPSIRLTEDWDMVLRLLRLGDLGFVDRVVIGYRRHGTNISSDATMPQRYDQVRSKTFWSADNTPEQQRLVRDAWHVVQRGYLRTHLDASVAHLRFGELTKAADRLARAGLAGWRDLRGRPPRPGPAPTASR